ncbi:MAG TPA: invasion associated locus B family protein [Rhizomicrobium sp.]|nr:invasion associated locus B family protein [Rhizomicrobium sp.]
MRNTVIGAVLAVVFVAALFALAHFAPRKPLPPAPDKIAAQVEQGFVGAKMIGPWQLVCLASPAIIGAATPAPPPSAPAPHAALPHTAEAPVTHKPISLGRCRVTLAYLQKDSPKHVILTVNFRLVGEAEKLLMVVRLPPVAKAGDNLVLQLGRGGLKLPVAGCQKESCMAAGVLGAQAQTGLFSTAKAELVLPPGANGKRAALPFPVMGLSAAITAMHRAES